MTRAEQLLMRLKLQQLRPMPPNQPSWNESVVQTQQAQSSKAIGRRSDAFIRTRVRFDELKSGLDLIDPSTELLLRVCFK